MEYTRKRTYGIWNDNHSEEMDLEAPCCSHPNVAPDRGYNVCLNCGSIQSRIYASIPQDQAAYYEKNSQKTVNVVLRHLGPRTNFDTRRDANGKYMIPKNIETFERLSKLDNRITTGIDRNLTIAHQDFLRLQKGLNVPFHVAEDAYKIYVIAAKKKLTHGRTINGIITACFFFALRNHQITRTLKEILEVSQISRKELVQSLKIIQIEILSKQKVKTSHLVPENFVEPFNESLNLSLHVGNEALSLVRRATQKGIPTSGRDPKGFAAAALYITSNLTSEPRTQKQISKAVNVSEVTLRKRIRELQYYLSIGGN